MTEFSSVADRRSSCAFRTEKKRRNKSDLKNNSGQGDVTGYFPTSALAKKFIILRCVEVSRRGVLLKNIAIKLRIYYFQKSTKKINVETIEIKPRKK